MEGDQGLQAFIDARSRCFKSVGGGRLAIDMDCFKELIRAAPEQARAYVAYECDRAELVPGYLQPAAAVAIAYKLAFGDDRLVQQVINRAEEVGGGEELYRLSTMPPR